MGWALTLFVTLAAMALPPQPSTHSTKSGEFFQEDSIKVADKTGKQLFLESCATCHGADGKGAQQSQLGFDTPPPDFTDCNFATREPDADWIAVAHEGGPVRGFSTDMPAFGEALTKDELQKLMSHIRSLCSDDWPRGDLNMPRPLVTEKAYPEDELVLASNINVEGSGGVMSEVVYEQRFGVRNQLEVVVPFEYREVRPGNWSGGYIGDVALGVKRAVWHDVNSGSILSLTGEVILPSGDENAGVGSGTTVLEPFFSFGQLLPAGGFLHLQGGAGVPVLRDKAADEVFGRGALGKTFTSGAWGRAWSPMVELLGAKEFEDNSSVQWELVPQMQVTLNTRQHIMLNVGANIPLDDPGRTTQFRVYILWDWFDGGFTEGW